MGSATEAGASVQASVQANARADAATSPVAVSRDRYTAVVAALLDVRIDHSSARFDAELQTALAEGRVDAATARALRWWQRASVQALSTYSATVLPAVLAARDAADQQAADEIGALAASWQQARSLQTAVVAPSPKPTKNPEPTRNPEPLALGTNESARPVAVQSAVAPPAVAPLAVAPPAVAPPAVAAPALAPPVAPALRRPAGRRNQPPHLVVVPDLASESDGRDGTRQAIREAFRALGTGAEVAAPDLDVTERKDIRGYADPAPTP
ncbi:MAG: hypothetical protein QOG69_2584 [Actinomycetota bacterium]|nr:hypothetical protein [Actinomycetota bacterium]